MHFIGSQSRFQFNHLLRPEGGNDNHRGPLSRNQIVKNRAIITRSTGGPFNAQVQLARVIIHH